jgi:hypothetical protein
VEGLANIFDAVPSKIASLLSECARSSSPVPKGSRGSNRSEVKIVYCVGTHCGANYVESLSFKKAFKSLIINSTVLDNVQRLHYLMVKLRACLKTQPFHMTWKLLVDGCNNPKIISAPSLEGRCCLGLLSRFL